MNNLINTIKFNPSPTFKQMLFKKNATGGGASSKDINFTLDEASICSMVGSINNGYTTSITFSGSNDGSTYETITETVGQKQGYLDTRGAITTKKYQYIKAHFTQSAGSASDCTLVVATL